MVPLDYVLAVAMLTVPGGLPEGEPLNEHSCLTRPIQALALQWEILDPREVICMEMRLASFDLDVRHLQRRYGELIDAPPLNDNLRFPGRELACEMLSFNRAYHSHITLRRDGAGKIRAELDEAIAETEHLYHVWDLVRDARSECYYVSVRRHALAALREAIGPGDYYRGALPPHVPVWRFERRE
jgi:hypothetical protein